MSSSADERTLYDKLEAMAKDPAAAPMEKLAAKAKLAKMDLQIKEQERTAERHGFTFRPSSNPRNPNAGWTFRNRHESDDGLLRKRDYKSPPRYQRGINRDAWINMQSEARSRVQFESEYLLKMFGLQAGDVTSPEQNRLRIAKQDQLKAVIQHTSLVNHISLINGKITKRLLFWTATKAARMYWFIVERDCVTGRTQTSRRYFSRDSAMSAHNLEQICWQRTEYT